MFSDVFLAMTGAELTDFHPKNTAYMACHFSPSGKGLSNLPSSLPPDSMLLLDDSMPPRGHDRSLAAKQLKEVIETFSVKAVLLDFQDKETDETRAMVSFLLDALPCPVAVTEKYAKALSCPVFLSPTPVNMSLKKQLAPWLQQGIYLEIAPMATQITVTEEGSTAVPLLSVANLPLFDKKLCCHYQVEVSKDKAVFNLCRTKEDLAVLVKEAKQLGVMGTVGLYQELKSI